MRALALIAALVCASASAAGPRNMNVGGQGGHLNVPLSGVILRLPLTASGMDECSGASIPGVTFTRSSSATCTKSDGTVVTLSANQPRVTAAGLLIEAGATNFFLNSGAPATQTITLSTTGSYTAWIDGSGSMAIAVGTATATGLPCTATSASACAFSITGAGTITATVTGSPVRAQVENSAIRTSYIPTAGTSAARTAETATIATPVRLSTSEGCTKVCVTPDWSGAPATEGRILDADLTSSNARLLYAPASVDAVRAYNGTTFPAVTAGFTSGTQRCYITRWSVAGNSLKVERLDNSTSNSVTFGGFTSFDSTIGLGSRTNGASPVNGSIANVQFGRTSGACQ